MVNSPGKDHLLERIQQCGQGRSLIEEVMVNWPGKDHVLAKIQQCGQGKSLIEEITIVLLERFKDSSVVVVKEEDNL